MRKNLWTRTHASFRGGTVAICGFGLTVLYSRTHTVRPKFKVFWVYGFFVTFIDCCNYIIFSSYTYAFTGDFPVIPSQRLIKHWKPHISVLIWRHRARKIISHAVWSTRWFNCFALTEWTSIKKMKCIDRHVGQTLFTCTIEMRRDSTINSPMYTTERTEYFWKTAFT